MAFNTTELCPEEQRRTARELYIKLFAVFFVVLGSFAHLIHVRRDYGSVISLVLFTIVSPITTATYLILPIPVLIFQFIYVKGDTVLLREAALALIGQFPKQNQPEEERQWKRSTFMIAALRAISPAAISVQCGMSIYYFSVRFRSDEAALYDHFVLQLVVIGILTSLLSILQLFPGIAFPATSWNELAKKTRWIELLRGPNLMHSRDRGGDIFYTAIWQTLLLSALGSVMSNICSSYGLNVYPQFDLFPDVVRDFLSRVAVWLYPSAVLLWTFFFLCLTWKSNSSRTRSPRKAFIFLTKLVFVTAVLIPCIMLFFGIIMFMYCFLLAQMLHNIRMFTIPRNFLDHQPLVFDDCSTTIEDALYSGASKWDYIPMFGEASVDCPCPEVLKNNVTDFLWMIG